MLRRKLDISLNHKGPHPVNVYHRTMSYGDLEAVAQLVQTEEEKNRVQQIINELAKDTLRGNLTAYWWLPLDSVSFAGIDEVSGSEEEKLYVNAVASLSRHHSDVNDFTVDLLSLEAITQALAALFGLTLPN